MRQADKKSLKKPGAAHNAAPGFLRRMTALCYDALLLLAVLFFATALALPFNAGQAFSSGQYFYPLYLLTISFMFYGWFWTHGGQTLGLRAWKIKVCAQDGGVIGWPQAGLRFLAAALSWACFGLGFLWCLLDKNGFCWHDYLSKTRIAWIDQEMR
ncbi:MAG: RDD family protein [Methylomonas sp.]